MLVGSGRKRGGWATAYDERRKGEIFDFALSATYLMLLSDIGWCLSENSNSASISKLNEIKPGIKLKIENQKKIHASNRATSCKDNKANTPYIRDGGGGGNGGGNNSKH